MPKAPLLAPEHPQESGRETCSVALRGAAGVDVYDEARLVMANDARVRDTGLFSPGSTLKCARHVLGRARGGRIGRHLLRTPQALTSDSLKQWASKLPGAPDEQRQRQCAAQRILQASRVAEDGALWPMSLDLSGLEALTSLPHHLRVACDLDLNGCSQLHTLGHGLQVGGHLNCAGCSSLRYIEAGFSVGGQACFEGCHQLCALPNGLRIGGNLKLDGCDNLRKLPCDMRIGGSLSAVCARRLEKLGSGLWVGRHIDIRFCEALKALPADLTCVRGDLHLDGCTRLAALPAQLSVQGDLNLSDCVSLVSFGLGLRVEKSISARRCVRLALLDATLRVGHHLDLSGCRRLGALPQNVEALFCGDAVLPHMLGLGRTRLAHLCASTLEPPQDGARLLILRRTYHRVRSQDNHPIAHLVSFWRNHASAVQTWRGDWRALLAWGMHTTEQKGLRTFLSRLKETADFCSRYTRALLADRVLSVLRAMDEHTDVRQIGLDYMHEALSSCDDRVTWVFGQIEQAAQVQICLDAAQSESALVELAKRYMRLDVVHQFAREKIESDPNADAVEVYLRYEIGVGACIALPVRHKRMLYPALGITSTQDITQAAAAAQAYAQDAAHLAAYMATWGPWQTHLRRQAARCVRYMLLPEVRVAKDTTATQLCILTQALWPTLQEPVCISGVADVHLVYELADLLTWWIRHGTEPMYKSHLDVAHLRRVVWEAECT